MQNLHPEKAPDFSAHPENFLSCLTWQGGKQHTGTISYGTERRKAGSGYSLSQAHFQVNAARKDSNILKPCSWQALE